MFDQRRDPVRGEHSIVTSATARGARIHRFAITAVLPSPNRHTIQVGEAKHAMTDDPSLNHSCDPSVLVDVVDEETIDIIAARALVAGEELTFFYPSTEWEVLEPFVCVCGSPRCLGLVTGAKDLAIEQLERVPVNPHIRRMLDVSGRSHRGGIDHE